jgi:hypothetical protein
LDFYVTLDAPDDFDGFAAFQLGGQIEVNDRFVHPHTVLVQGAFHVRTRRLRAGNVAKNRDNQECSKRPTHVSSAGISKPVVFRGASTP